MRKRIATYATLLIAVSAVLTGCGSDESEQIGTNTAESGSEAPQYVEPTMDQLRGKEQPFPSRYPVSRYPKSRVAFACVKPNLPMGYRNQVMLNVNEQGPEVVAAYYKAELDQGGWKKVYEWENCAYSSTKWQKGGMEVEVRVSPDNYGNQNVQLFYGQVFRRQYPPHE